ncbi:MAG: hypothetical protein LIP28_05930 [Deltaproteobacteria bacterium]|nr:hypothetical protein [Deltaproteobacteria bacterium]
MDREKVAQSMEEVVQSYRKQLAENDDSKMANLGNSMKMGFESLRGMVAGSESDKQSITMFKRYADNFEDALKDGNRAGASRALDDLEKSIQAFRIRSDAIN